MTSQIISKKRVSDHGEVFTAEREVNAMLDLVKQETERIDSRFLEPACGTGNFLIPIIQRKLAIVKQRYSKSRLEFERYAVIAIGSVYGVDILEDSVEQCRQRLYAEVNQFYTSLYKSNVDEKFRKTLLFILERNIIHGDAITLRTVKNNNAPIVFSEWSLVQGSKVKRRDFSFEEILQKQGGNVGLFANIDINNTDDPYFIPEPLKEYPLTHYLELPYATA
ncbi:SAM-dependent DNA methyltransferase [Patescibacteria group bacterium]|nr:SAM-dependent DNA methyltransferase [Patescibacteria group bacterium]